MSKIVIVVEDAVYLTYNHNNKSEHEWYNESNDGANDRIIKIDSN